MPGTTPITFEISLLVSTAGGCERASSAPFGRAVAQKLKANSGLQRCQLGSSEYYSIGFLQDQISNRRGSPPLGEEAFAGCLQVARIAEGKGTLPDRHFVAKAARSCSEKIDGGDYTPTQLG